MSATFPDLLRLLAVPAFAWAAWSDLRTRRVPDELWIPFIGLGFLLLGWDAWQAWLAGDGAWDALSYRITISIGLVPVLAYYFWQIDGYGGADAKAIMIIGLLFPTYPAYSAGGLQLPVVEPRLDVFVFTVFANAVVVAVLAPVFFAVRNLFLSRVSPVFFLGWPVRVDRLAGRDGRLLETPEGYTTRGVDLDAIRSYLRWRDVSYGTLLGDPDRFRDDESDPWRAEDFADEARTYGADAEDVRAALDRITDAEQVWIAPSMPFLVPLLVGLVLALTFGDVMVAVLF